MLNVEYRYLAWWYWLITVSLLTAGVSGWPSGFQWAVAVTVVQLVHFAARARTLVSFTIQVRVAYLIMLLLFLPLPLHALYWLPIVGTWVVVLSGYCMMARLVSLLPWNRTETLSTNLLRRTFLSPPVRRFSRHPEWEARA